MNYGRKGAKRRLKELTAKGRRIRNKLKVLLLTLLLVLFVYATGMAGYTAYGYVVEILEEAPDISEIDATPSGYMSVVYDTDGNITASLVASGSNRVYVTIDEIPLDLQHAFVAIEDERFYEHNGIDLKGIFRAGYVAISSGSLSEGASTITQQLLKNNVFDGWTSETKIEKITRKLQEQYLAVQLEKEVDKDWIMENYLNTINLGQNTLGVQSAATRYFGKDVSELCLSECAVIAAITQNPSKYNPISYPENNRERQQKVLKNMLEQGYITQAEYEEAISDDVYARISENNTTYETDTANVTSYFVDALTEQVIEDLQNELGYTEAQAYKALYSGGLSIYSTQDSTIQAICDEAVNDSSNYAEITSSVSFSYSLTLQLDDGSLENYSEQNMLSWLKEEKGISSLNYSSEEAAEAAVSEYREALVAEGGTVIGESLTYTLQPQASVTIIDQTTGEVKAIVGGRGDKTASKTLNRATDSTMQPGSTFKILTTYAPALELGLINLATTVVDEEITYSSGQVVKNAGGSYRGATTIRQAIISSINVVAIKVSREVTLETCYEYALKFGISTLTESDVVEALPLGGITNGVTNMELTAAYAAIANGGTYNEPILYTQIVDHDGNILIDNTPETHEVISETTAWLLTSAMEDVVSSGTGGRANFSGMSIAGKTGTTNSSRASWFVGFTPYYTCAVWGGYDDNSQLSSTNFTKYLWKSIMSTLHEGLTDTGFPMPSGISTYTICSDTGLLAGEDCVNTHTDYAAGSNVLTEVCEGHDVVDICTASGLLATPYCPEDEVETQVFLKEVEDEEEAAPTEYCTLHEAPEEEEETASPQEETATAVETETAE